MSVEHQERAGLRDKIRYTRDVYAGKWLGSREFRLQSDYYRRDHYYDTLNAIAREPGSRVLDCGVGTGEFFARELIRSGKEFYGIDFAAKLIRECKELFWSIGEQVRIGMARLEELPFPSGVFDVTFAIGVLPYVPEPDVAVREMVRVTRKGGLVVFDAMNKWHVSQLINFWYCALESCPAGFEIINALKGIKKRIFGESHIKEVREELNYRLLSPLTIGRILKVLPVTYYSRGYNVLLPLSLPILGHRSNWCERFPLFSHGLKDQRILKQFGAKLVYYAKVS